MGVCLSCSKTRRATQIKDKSNKFDERFRAIHVCAEPENHSVGQVNGELPAISMANTISNMKIPNPIKGLVSKRRKRYMADGFNLDLTYITNNVIAMGYPAEKLEGVYRNHIDDVVKFLDSKHKDHYKIYNLCSERSYDIGKFHKRVSTYPFDDHNPPKMELIQPFCDDVHKWLMNDINNVAVVHCKAGKGRTGTMICCYLLHSRQFPNADEALNFYGQMRTHDEKGVTIPSQRRYVNYYATLLNERITYNRTTLFIKEIQLSSLPNFNTGVGMLQFAINQSSDKLYTSPVYEINKQNNSFKITLDQCIPLIGDIKLEFCNKPKMMRKEKLFHFWFNTFFVTDEVNDENGDSMRTLSYDEEVSKEFKTAVACRRRSASQPNVNVELKTLALSLSKWELDDAHKDKQNKVYSPDFRVNVLMQRVPPPRDGTRTWLSTHKPIHKHGHSAPHHQTTPPQHLGSTEHSTSANITCAQPIETLGLTSAVCDTPSESSDADNSNSDGEDTNEDEDGWDSGECSLIGARR